MAGLRRRELETADFKFLIYIVLQVTLLICVWCHSEFDSTITCPLPVILVELCICVRASAVQCVCVSETWTGGLRDVSLSVTCSCTVRGR